MAIIDQWPEFAPDIQLKVDISSGVMTLISPSALNNKADFDLSAPDVRGTVFKNGVKAGSVTINAGSGALSISGVSVSTGDAIVFEFKFLGQLSTVYNTRVVLSRIAFLTVPAGNSQTLFDATHNQMPVPGYDIAFGWSSGNLKAGVKVNSADNAGQSPLLYTRLFGTSPDQESSTTISLANTTTEQSNTSSFDADDMVRDAEMELYLQSGTGTTRQEERVRIIWSHRDDIPTYPGSFPSSGKQLVLLKVNGGVKLYKP